MSTEPTLVLLSEANKVIGKFLEKYKGDLLDNNFTEAVRIMANTPPVSNEEIIKRSKQSKS